MKIRTVAVRYSTLEKAKKRPFDSLKAVRQGGDPSFDANRVEPITVFHKQ